MIGRLIRGLFKLFFTIAGIVVIAAVIAVVWVELACRPATMAEARAPSIVTVEGYQRAEANTYFTFPEWYVVYAFEDFGSYLEDKSESGYPYFRQIAGFWESTCAANRLGAALPGNHFEYKTMIYVIGLSFTFEFLVKALYENTIGRVTELFRGPVKTPEDVYAKNVVQEYGAFMHQVPWYEFPFMAKLDGLWHSAPFIGDSPVRNVERKFALSAEYLVKAAYAKVIALGLAATSAPADLEIMFVVRGNADAILAAEPTVKLVEQLPNGDLLLIAPRYRAFTDTLKRLTATSDVEVVEIAGNRHILMSAIVPDDAIRNVAGARVLFMLPLAARPGFSRVGYDVDVASLAQVLRAYAAEGIAVEHLYDY